MKGYKSSDYAANKYSKGIVYRFADETVEITLEKYLAENPDKTEANFWELKALSDEIYFKQDRAENAQTKKNVSIHQLEETEACAAKPIEEYIDDQEYNEILRAIQQFLDSGILTETQKRRFILYFFKGLTMYQIAELEQVNVTSVFRALNYSLEKIKKFFQDMQ